MAFGGGGGTPFGAPSQSSLFGSVQSAGNAPLFGGSSSSAPLFGASSPPAAQQRPAFGVTPTPGFGAGAAAPSGFGAASSSAPAFGQPTQQPAFGSSGSTGMFGQPPAAGGGAAFGQPSGGGGLFGSSVASSGGLFGSAASAPAFGSSSTPAFGATAGSAFGAAPTSGFGQAAQPQQQSAFGAPATQGGGLFGQSSAGFGQSAPGFGQSAPAFGQQSAPAFGAAAPTSAFGQAPSAAFGQSSVGFGQPSAALFGNVSSMQGQGQVGVPGQGTAGVKWAIVQESEGNPPQVAKYNTITMMPAFKTRSLEELRLEDYVAGNTATGPGPGVASAGLGQSAGFGAPPQASGAVGAFGQSTPAFGQSTPAFGQPASAFGNSAPAFGQGASAFGQSAPAFGAPPQSGSSFGASTFGAPAQSSGGLFGAKPAQPGSSLFGQQASGGGLFGTAAPGASVFGQQTSAAGSLFGGSASSQPSLFGSTQSQPGFGASQPGLFGQPQSQASLFGAQGATSGSSAGGAFGAPAVGGSTGLFGTAPTPGAGSSGSSLFGNGGAGSSQPSLFGGSAAPSTQQQTQGFSTGGFGAATAAGVSGGLFGSSSSAAALGGSASVPGLSLNLPSSGIGGGLFSSSAPAASGLGSFGGSMGQSSGGLFGGAGSGFGLSSSSLSGGFNSGPSLFGSSAGTLSSGASLFGNSQNQQHLQPGAPGSLTASLDTNPFGASSLFPSTAGSAALPPPGALTGRDTTLFSTPYFGVGISSVGSAAARRRDQRAGPGRATLRLRTRSRASALRRNGELSLFESGNQGSGKFASSLSFGAPSARPWAPVDTVSSPHRSSVRSGSATVTALERPSRASTLKKLVIKPRGSDSEAGEDRDVRDSQGEASTGVRASPFLHAALSSKIATPASVVGSRRILQFDTPRNGASLSPLKGEPSSPHGNDPSLIRPTPVRADGGNEQDGLAPFGEPGSYSEYLRGELSKVASATPSSQRIAKDAKPDDSQVNHVDPEHTEDRENKELGLEATDFVDGDTGNGHNVKPEDESDVLANPPGFHPISTRSEMYTQPPLLVLQEMTEDQLAAVEEFSVGIEGIGLVEWPGETDVRYLNLDRDVSIKSREVVVYPDDASRPAVGAGLNKPARVSLFGLWKRDRATKLPIKDASGAAAMVRKLKAHCDREGLVFLGYDVSDGKWTFETPHF